jgi:hypothetical protein
MPLTNGEPSSHALAHQPADGEASERHLWPSPDYARQLDALRASCARHQGSDPGCHELAAHAVLPTKGYGMFRLFPFLRRHHRRRPSH